MDQSYGNLRMKEPGCVELEEWSIHSLIFLRCSQALVRLDALMKEPHSCFDAAFQFCYILICCPGLIMVPFSINSINKDSMTFPAEGCILNHCYHNVPPHRPSLGFGVIIISLRFITYDNA
jgi:hypothetical protein